MFDRRILTEPSSLRCPTSWDSSAPAMREWTTRRWTAGSRAMFRVGGEGSPFLFLFSVPIHTVDDDFDFLLNPDRVCPRNAAFRKFLNTCKDVKAIADDNKVKELYTPFCSIAVLSGPSGHAHKDQRNERSEHLEHLASGRRVVSEFSSYFDCKLLSSGSSTVSTTNPFRPSSRTSFSTRRRP